MGTDRPSTLSEKEVTRAIEDMLSRFNGKAIEGVHESIHKIAKLNFSSASALSELLNSLCEFHELYIVGISDVLVSLQKKLASDVFFDSVAKDFVTLCRQSCLTGTRMQMNTFLDTATKLLVLFHEGDIEPYFRAMDSLVSLYRNIVPEMIVIDDELDSSGMASMSYDASRTRVFEIFFHALKNRALVEHGSDLVIETTRLLQRKGQQKDGSEEKGPGEGDKEGDGSAKEGVEKKQELEDDDDAEPVEHNYVWLMPWIEFLNCEHLPNLFLMRYMRNSSILLRDNFNNPSFAHRFLMNDAIFKSEEATTYLSDVERTDVFFRESNLACIASFPTGAFSLLVEQSISTSKLEELLILLSSCHKHNNKLKTWYGATFSEQTIDWTNVWKSEVEQTFIACRNSGLGTAYLKTIETPHLLNAYVSSLCRFENGIAGYLFIWCQALYHKNVQIAIDILNFWKRHFSSDEDGRKLTWIVLLLYRNRANGQMTKVLECLSGFSDTDLEVCLDADKTLLICMLSEEDPDEVTSKVKLIDTSKYEFFKFLCELVKDLEFQPAIIEKMIIQFIEQRMRDYDLPGLKKVVSSFTKALDHKPMKFINTFAKSDLFTCLMEVKNSQLVTERLISSLEVLDEEHLLQEDVPSHILKGHRLKVHGDVNEYFEYLTKTMNTILGGDSYKFKELLKVLNLLLIRIGIESKMDNFCQQECKEFYWNAVDKIAKAIARAPMPLSFERALDDVGNLVLVLPIHNPKVTCLKVFLHAREIVSQKIRNSPGEIITDIEIVDYIQSLQCIMKLDYEGVPIATKIKLIDHSWSLITEREPEVQDPQTSNLMIGMWIYYLMEAGKKRGKAAMEIITIQQRTLEKMRRKSFEDAEEIMLKNIPEEYHHIVPARRECFTKEVVITRRALFAKEDHDFYNIMKKQKEQIDTIARSSLSARQKTAVLEILFGEVPFYKILDASCMTNWSEEQDKETAKQERQFLFQDIKKLSEKESLSRSEKKLIIQFSFRVYRQVFNLKNVDMRNKIEVGDQQKLTSPVALYQYITDRLRHVGYTEREITAELVYGMCGSGDVWLVNQLYNSTETRMRFMLAVLEKATSKAYIQYWLQWSQSEIEKKVGSEEFNVIKIFACGLDILLNNIPRIDPELIRSLLRLYMDDKIQKDARLESVRCFVIIADQGLIKEVREDLYSMAFANATVAVCCAYFVSSFTSNDNALAVVQTTSELIQKCSEGYPRKLEERHAKVFGAVAELYLRSLTQRFEAEPAAKHFMNVYNLCWDTQNQYEPTVGFNTMHAVITEATICERIKDVLLWSIVNSKIPAEKVTNSLQLFRAIKSIQNLLNLDEDVTESIQDLALFHQEAALVCLSVVERLITNQSELSGHALEEKESENEEVRRHEDELECASQDEAEEISAEESKNKTALAVVNDDEHDANDVHKEKRKKDHGREDDEDEDEHRYTPRQKAMRLIEAFKEKYSRVVILDTFTEHGFKQLSDVAIIALRRLGLVSPDDVLEFMDNMVANLWCGGELLTFAKQSNEKVVLVFQTWETLLLVCKTRNASDAPILRSLYSKAVIKNHLGDKLKNKISGCLFSDRIINADLKEENECKRYISLARLINELLDIRTHFSDLSTVVGCTERLCWDLCRCFDDSSDPTICRNQLYKMFHDGVLEVIDSVFQSDENIAKTLRYCRKKKHFAKEPGIQHLPGCFRVLIRRILTCNMKRHPTMVENLSAILRMPDIMEANPTEPSVLDDQNGTHDDHKTSENADTECATDVSRASSAKAIHRDDKSELSSEPVAENSLGSKYLADVKDYILRIRGNQQSMARLEAAGYNKSRVLAQGSTTASKDLWRCNSIEISGFLEIDNSLGQRDESYLCSIWWEWKDLLREMGIKEVVLTDGTVIATEDLFVNVDLEKTKLQVERIKETTLCCPEELSCHRERLIESERKFLEKQKAKEKGEETTRQEVAKELTVAWENRFFESVKLCSGKIPACYAPNGFNSQKPIDCGLCVDNKLLTVFIEEKKNPRVELENVEVKLLEVGMFVWSLYRSDHRYHTDELWAKFYQMLLEERLVPRIILPFPGSPGRKWIEKFIKPAKRQDVPKYGWEFYYDVIPKENDEAYYDSLPCVKDYTVKKNQLVILTADNVRKFRFKDLKTSAQQNTTKELQKKTMRMLSSRTEIKEINEKHLPQRLGSVVCKVCSKIATGAEHQTEEDIAQVVEGEMDYPRLTHGSVSAEEKGKQWFVDIVTESIVKAKDELEHVVD